MYLTACFPATVLQTCRAQLTTSVVTLVNEGTFSKKRDFFFPECEENGWSLFFLKHNVLDLKNGVPRSCVMYMAQLSW